MSPKIKSFFVWLKVLLWGKEKEIPNNQDALGAYPLRMQISSIPERRYLRMSRLLAILTLINIGILIALAGSFVYDARRIDVSVANSRAVNLYAMDPETKVIKAAEYYQKSVPALWLVQEQAIRDFINARYGYSADEKEQAGNWGNGSPLQQYMDSKSYQNFMESESFAIKNEIIRKKISKEVHIYSLNQTPTGMWEALIDIFDMPPRDPFEPVCVCMDNSPECLSCKIEHSIGRKRFKVYARTVLRANPPSQRNPFGIQIPGSFALLQVIHPQEQFWGIPSVLKPDL